MSSVRDPSTTPPQSSPYWFSSLYWATSVVEPSYGLVRWDKHKRVVGTSVLFFEKIHVFFWTCIIMSEREIITFGRLGEMEAALKAALSRSTDAAGAVQHLEASSHWIGIDDRTGNATLEFRNALNGTLPRTIYPRHYPSFLLSPSYCLMLTPLPILTYVYESFVLVHICSYMCACCVCICSLIACP